MARSALSEVLRKLSPVIDVVQQSRRDDSRALVKLGNEHRDARRWEDAADAYRKALEQNPAAFAIWVQLGHVLKETKDLAAAMVAYEQALQLNGKDHDLHLQIGHLYTVMGRPLKARERYAEAAALGSVDPHALRAASLGAASAGDMFLEGDTERDSRAWAEAAIAYEKGLEAEPNAFEVWVQLGHVCKEMGASDRAEAAYRRAYDLRPNDVDLNVQFGHFYTRCDDEVRATDFYRRALALGSRDRHALRFLAKRAGADRSLAVVMSRLVQDQKRKQAILSEPVKPGSFARYVLRHTA